MLSNDAFFRNVPKAVDLESRLRWEVLLNASDGMSYAYGVLTNTLNQINQLQDFNDAEPLRPIVSGSCWSIIDQAHALFQILNTVKRVPGGVLDSHLAKYQSTVKHLRNSMDHIHQKISNLSKKKKVTYGLYGAVSFTTPLDDSAKYDFVQFWLGSLQFGKQAGLPIDTHAMPTRSGISNVSFAAFDQVVNISNLMIDTRTVLEQMDSDVRDYVVASIAVQTAGGDFDLETIMNETTRGTVYARFHMVQGDI